MKYKNGFFVIFILFGIFGSLSLVLAKEPMQILTKEKKIVLSSLNAFFIDGIQDCANWDLNDNEIKIFFGGLSKESYGLPENRVSLSCEIEGKLKLGNTLWQFYINAGGFGHLKNKSQEIFFTCGYFLDANPKCDELFIQVPDSFEDDFTIPAYQIPPLFDKQ